MSSALYTCYLAPMQTGAGREKERERQRDLHHIKPSQGWLDMQKSPFEKDAQALNSEECTDHRYCHIGPVLVL